MATNYMIRSGNDATLRIPDGTIWIENSGIHPEVHTLFIPASVRFIFGHDYSYLPNLVRIWTSTKIGAEKSIVVIGPGTPTLKELKGWVFARYNTNYTDQLWMSTLPIELCELVFSYIPDDAARSLRH
jgi:hypothetical protein